MHALLNVSVLSCRRAPTSRRHHPAYDNEERSPVPSEPSDRSRQMTGTLLPRFPPHATCFLGASLSTSNITRRAGSCLHTNLPIVNFAGHPPVRPNLVVQTHPPGPSGRVPHSPFPPTPPRHFQPRPCQSKGRCPQLTPVAPFHHFHFSNPVHLWNFPSHLVAPNPSFTHETSLLVYYGKSPEAPLCLLVSCLLYAPTGPIL